MTRAIPMDELLLQLAESLRKTLGLSSAEIYTGVGEVLERTASVPDLGPGSIVVSPRERPVVTRAGVSGTAWASIWLPSLLAGRDADQPRGGAPVGHRGEDAPGSSWSSASTACVQAFSPTKTTGC